LFWEVMLIPMYFLIGIWGHGRRIYAALKFVLYTMFGSILMLVAILWLYNISPGTHNLGPTFDLPEIQARLQSGIVTLPPTTELLLFGDRQNQILNRKCWWRLRSIAKSIYFTCVAHNLQTFTYNLAHTVSAHTGVQEAAAVIIENQCLSLASQLVASVRYNQAVLMPPPNALVRSSRASRTFFDIAVD